MGSDRSIAALSGFRTQTETDRKKADGDKKTNPFLVFMWGQYRCVQLSHTSTCSSEEPNPPWITGRLGLDYAASENPGQRAALLSIRGDSGPHLLPHSRVEEDSSARFQGRKQKRRRICWMKCNVVLTFFISPPKKQSTICEMFYNMTSYPGRRYLQESMSVCMAQEVLYCPCKHFTTSRVCSNAPKCNYLEKVDHKNMQFKENGVKKS